LQEFEWDSKSNIGLIWGFVGRHLSCGVRPDPNVIQRFGRFTELMFEKLFQDINALPITLIPLRDWILSKKGWGKGK